MVWTLNWTVSTLAYQREKIFEKFLREKLEILKMVCSCGVGLPSLHSTNCPLQTLNILKSHFQGKKCKKYNNLTKKNNYSTKENINLTKENIKETRRKSKPKENLHPFSEFCVRTHFLDIDPSLMVFILSSPS